MHAVSEEQWRLAQERAKELAAHEQQLEDWKKRFKAEALRQISEREKALTEWQGQLEGSRAELEHLKENMEVVWQTRCLRPHACSDPMHFTLRFTETRITASTRSNPGFSLL